MRAEGKRRRRPEERGGKSKYERMRCVRNCQVKVLGHVKKQSILFPLCSHQFLSLSKLRASKRTVADWAYIKQNVVCHLKRVCRYTFPVSLSLTFLPREQCDLVFFYCVSREIDNEQWTRLTSWQANECMQKLRAVYPLPRSQNAPPDIEAGKNLEKRQRAHGWNSMEPGKTKFRAQREEDEKKRKLFSTLFPIKCHFGFYWCLFRVLRRRWLCHVPVGEQTRSRRVFGLEILDTFC